MEMYLKLYSFKYKKTWIKKFTCEFDMDKFKRKLKYIKDIVVLEDSRELYYPDYNR